MNPPAPPGPNDDDDRTVIRPSQFASGFTAFGDSSMGQSDFDPGAMSLVVGNTLGVGTRLGEFEISGVVGEGGFGIVYLAWDHSLQRRVAIKEYMPSSLASRTQAMTVAVKSDRFFESFSAGLKSFVNEAKLLARFDHPAMLKVHRFWEANGTAYMVMPYYEGGTLKQALAASGHRPDEGWLKEFLAPLMDALEHLHQAQCFHRDIAPDNIILLDDGRPLLLDFGAARRVIGDMTHALTVILKPGYAPVEQYAEMPTMRQGPWTDVYALGAVVHYALTGATPPTSVARILVDEYQPLAQRLAGQYDDEFLRGIDRMLAVRPEHRLPGMAEVREALGLQRPRLRRAPPPATTAGPPTPATRIEVPEATELDTDFGAFDTDATVVPPAAPPLSPPLSPPPVPPAEPDPAATIVAEPVPRAAPPAVPPAPAPAPIEAAAEATLPPRAAAPVAPPAAEAPMPLPPAQPTVQAVPATADAAPQRSLWPVAAVLALAVAVAGWWFLRGAPEASPPVVVNPPAAPEPAPATPAPAAAPPVAQPAAATTPPAVVATEPAPPATAPPASATAAAEPPPTPPAEVTPPPAEPAPRVATPLPRPTERVPERRTERPAAPAPRAEGSYGNTEPAPRPAPRIDASARCADILQRVSLGEDLTAEERRILRQECRR